MARPTKEGLDYFPLDVDIDQDDKVIIIIAKHGMQGFGILIKLLMEIYKHGYSYQWTEKEQLIFSSRVSVDINLVNEVVNDCIKWGLFNEKIFNEQKTLTSKGIQERYLLATSRRVKTTINADINLVSVDINPKSEGKVSAKSTQSKVKEKKLNKTKENNNIAAVNPFNFYQQNFGVLSSFISEDIGQWIEDLNSELVIESMKIALQNNKPWKYAVGILKDWHKNNLKTLEDVQAHNLKRDKQFKPGAAKRSLFEQGEESKRRQAEPYKPIEGLEGLNLISDDDLPY